MMKKLKSLFVIAALAMIYASCTYKAPSILTQNPTGTKAGCASGIVYFNIFAFDADCSLQAAAINDVITQIARIDTKVTNILRIFWTYETITNRE
ncbi:MAG: TRL domain-containing protein [Bacteroidia bacterium]